MKPLSIFAILLILTIANANAATWTCSDVIKASQPQGAAITYAASCLPTASSDLRPLCFSVAQIDQNTYSYQSVRFSENSDKLETSVVNSVSNKEIKITQFYTVLSNTFNDHGQWKRTTYHMPSTNDLVVDYYRQDNILKGYQHVESQSYNCKAIESL